MIDYRPPCGFHPDRKRVSCLAAIGFLCVGAVQEQGPEHAVRLTIKSQLPADLGRIPMDPTIDFGALIRKAGISGGLDPRSIKVVNLATQDFLCACDRLDKNDKP